MSILQIEYWIKNGFTELEAKEKISVIQKERYAKALKTKKGKYKL
jgi:hypothetical protein